MGTYVYKITAKKVACSDGKEANVAVYAYKPSWGDDKFNARCEFRTGCHVAERYAQGPNMTDRFVIGHVEKDFITIYEDHAIYHNPHKLGTMYDSAFGNKNIHPELPGVKIVRLGRGLAWEQKKVKAI